MEQENERVGFWRGCIVQVKVPKSQRGPRTGPDGWETVAGEAVDVRPGDSMADVVRDVARRLHRAPVDVRLVTIVEGNKQ